MERGTGPEVRLDPEADARQRDRTAVIRDETAEERDRAGDARDEASGRRDDAADQRDVASDDRDRLADLRDEAGDRRDEAADRRDEAGQASERRLREEAASDRRGSAGDRQRNAVDRLESADQRASAVRDRATAGEDRAAGSDQRHFADADRAAAHGDRGESASERETAYLDDLTAAFRRGPGFIDLDREVARATRTGQPLTVVFFDVDRLKQVNDTHGHAAGDRLLRAVADVLRAHLRPYDTVIRYGGDEFVCVMGGIDVARARQRLSTVNAQLDEVLPGSSISAGMAQWEVGETVADLVHRADESLHRTREAGTARAAE